MKIDLDTLCRKIEMDVPTARAKVAPEAKQIVVTFTNRPDVEVALLTPYFQSHVVKDEITVSEEEITDLLFSIRRISFC